MYNYNLGLKPVLFEVFGYKIEAYPFFVILALITGLLIYMIQLRMDGIRNSNAIYIAIFAILFGTIGSKLPIVIMYWDEINNSAHPLDILYSGRTIVGGLVGGFLGTFLAKKLFNIKERMGNQLAIPVAFAMAVGRLGCLFRGCCYGIQAKFFWGIDFGDSIYRHPTQIYEIIFDVLLGIYLIYRKKKGVLPGQLFKIFLNSYLVFRFLLEFIRVEKVSFIGFTDFQLLCAVSVAYINREGIKKLLIRKKGE